jgi:hypothetical protein
LAAFDFDLWAQLNNCEFTDSLIAQSLWPDSSVKSEVGSFDPIERLRKTTRPKVQEIISYSTVNRFWKQLELENFLKKVERKEI